MDPQNYNSPPIPFTSANAAPQSVTFVIHPRELQVFQVTAEELESITTAGNMKALDVALFSVCITAALTVWTVLATVEKIEPRINESFSAVLFASVVGTIFFG